MARARNSRPSRQAANAAKVAICSQQQVEEEALSNPRSGPVATDAESPPRLHTSAHSSTQVASTSSSEDKQEDRKHVSPEAALPERPQKRQAKVPSAEQLIQAAIVDCQTAAEQAHASGDFDQWPKARIAEEKKAHLTKMMDLIVSSAYKERLEQTQGSLLLGDMLESQVAEEMMHRTAEAESYLIAYVNCLMRSRE